MRDSLHRFFRAARGAGVRISSAESIDAMRAVAEVGPTDRAILRDALLLTLAKNSDEKAALRDCFDTFFDHPEFADAPPEASDTDHGDAAPAQVPTAAQPPAELGALAQMLLSQDRATMAAALSGAANAAGLTDIRFFTQRGIYSSRMLEQLGVGRLREDLDALAASNPAEADRLATALGNLRETVGEAVSQALLLYGREEKEALRNEILRNAPMARLEPRQVEQMRALIRRIARRLRERFSKPRKRQRRGHLDVRRTMRRNAAWGGIPFMTAWKRRHRDRPKIVAICDVVTIRLLAQSAAVFSVQVPTVWVMNWPLRLVHAAE